MRAPDAGMCSARGSVLAGFRCVGAGARGQPPEYTSEPALEPGCAAGSADGRTDADTHHAQRFARTRRSAKDSLQGPCAFRLDDVRRVVVCRALDSRHRSFVAEAWSGATAGAAAG